MSDTVSKISALLEKCPVFLAATRGFDKAPQLHKAELCFLENGIPYFAVPKCTVFYGELSTFDHLVLAAYLGEDGVTLRLSGQPVFTEDEETITRCLNGSAVLKRAWENEPGMLIAYFLKDMKAELLYDDGSSEEEMIGTPENVITGISFRKDRELRDRLISVMERREAEAAGQPAGEELEKRKLLDGTLLYMAAKAKEVWPRMDIGPAERSALFETYDEREHYESLASKRLGNACISKPEDITYWLSDSSL